MSAGAAGDVEPLDAGMRESLAASCGPDAPVELQALAARVREGRTSWEAVWERPPPALVGRVLADVARRWAPSGTVGA
ncbi:hypothetical protein [Nocardioides marmotae]|uniref:hypothetical protein n=1 Tax=Nocardioides marmotae TaxID=2663857 RepID=UPI0012B62C8E|nr:hypothetical protein [Nocardioides marmotae]MBC9734889.1 hypothetical protein [Nocardioides marmotae]MTB85990.1 hypothetical protein [Nocardioides marmotae]